MVDLSIKNGDFPLNYQRVYHFLRQTRDLHKSPATGLRNRAPVARSPSVRLIESILGMYCVNVGINLARLRYNSDLSLLK